MISYDEALEEAREICEEVDVFTEYEHAYVFSISNDYSFGGSNAPVVVLKDSGECVNFPYFVGAYQGEKELGNGMV